MIITLEPNSKELGYFKKLGCEFVEIPPDPNISHTLLKQYKERPSFVSETHKQKMYEILEKKEKECLENSLFVKTFIGTLIPYPSAGVISLQAPEPKLELMFLSLDLDQVSKIDNIDDLFTFVLGFFEGKITSTKDKFISTVASLCITQKGLTAEEIMKLNDISSQEWDLLVAIFKLFILVFNGLWKVNNEPFKEAFMKKYFENQRDKLRGLHGRIASTLKEKEENSIRKLEEQCYHIFMSKNMFSLKETLANIENFLLLFAPATKYDLCRYWQRLTETGFDPVAEYNKSLDLFEMHFRPSNKDLFLIFLQITRFLKEFADFDTIHTPQFRHPPVM